MLTKPAVAVAIYEVALVIDVLRLTRLTVIAHLAVFASCLPLSLAGSKTTARGDTGKSLVHQSITVRIQPIAGRITVPRLTGNAAIGDRAVDTEFLTRGRADALTA